MKLYQVHVNHPDKEDIVSVSLNDGTSTIIITSEQARHFAHLLQDAADQANKEVLLYKIRQAVYSN